MDRHGVSSVNILLITCGLFVLYEFDGIKVCVCADEDLWVTGNVISVTLQAINQKIWKTIKKMSKSGIRLPYFDIPE